MLLLLLLLLQLQLLAVSHARLNTGKLTKALEYY